jgi:hypothetical protein
VERNGADSAKGAGGCQGGGGVTVG